MNQPPTSPMTPRLGVTADAHLEFAQGLAALFALPAIVTGLREDVSRLASEVALLRTTMPPTLLTIEQAARQLRVSASTLRRRIKAGELAVVRIGRAIRIDARKLQPTEEADVVRIAHRVLSRGGA